MRTLAMICSAVALAGCAARIAAEDVDQGAAARQAADKQRTLIARIVRALLPS